MVLLLLENTHTSRDEAVKGCALFYFLCKDSRNIKIM